MNVQVALDGVRARIDLGHPISLAAPVSFAPDAPSYFGAPPAASRPVRLPGFSGCVAEGASCNCSSLSLTPHCHGTHTECVGHLTREPLDAWQVAPIGWMFAALLTVPGERADSEHGRAESSDPAPRPGDRLITRAALLERWPRGLASEPRALVLRTQLAKPLGRGAEPVESGALPPYLSREAATLLVERRIEHLVVDLPSIDRLADEGRLTAHRIFFGLPPGARDVGAAQRPHCTVTELARIPPDTHDGGYLLELQLPALAGDAVPSRPLLHPLLPA